jgi:hypothetical protein
MVPSFVQVWISICKWNVMQLGDNLHIPVNLWELLGGLYHMYATTRYNFVRLKATHKISPLEELVGGEISPLAVPRG